MPPTSCLDHEILGYIPTIFLKGPNRDDLRRNFDSARKHRISSKWSFTEVIQKIAAEPSPNARPVPSFALDGGQFRLQPVWAPQPASFSGFQTSQVWVADVFKADDGVTSQQHEPERVVLKILQPSMRPFPNMKGIRRGSPAHQLAYSEEVLYKHLRLLQGSHIPYYFGTFEVALPNGEDAYILILEYIEGEVAEKWVQKYEMNQIRAHETLPVTINSIMDAFRAIRAAYVAHPDVFRNLCNIIIRKDGTAVIIDFADCALLKTAEDTARIARSYSRDENQGHHCVRLLLHCCLSNTDGLARAEIQEWIDTPGQQTLDQSHSEDGDNDREDDDNDKDINSDTENLEQQPKRDLSINHVTLAVTSQ
ncbi:hypothetical protein BDZ89DRAFT_1161200 [Hymenopellis radicata]|nr:hypothetical protein BDZ89DRAFT_1161200 [Hymenopellis radicata]